jgi:hypothetical protein
MATKKAAAKPVAKKTAAAPSDRTDKMIEKISSMRAKGLKWREISDEISMPIGKAILLFEMGKVKKSDRITGTDSEIGKAIVRAREVDKLSWGRIMARTGMGQQACKNLYEKYSKDPAKGARIGKGGRYPGGATPAKPAATKATKAPAVKAKAKAAPAAKVKPTKAAKVTDIREAKAKKDAVAKRPRKRIAANPGEAAVGAEDAPF